MVYLRVYMVRTSCEHDTVDMVFFYIVKHFFTLGFDVVTCLINLVPAGFAGVYDFFPGNFTEFADESVSDCLKRSEGKKRITKINFTVFYRFYVIPYIFRIRGYDRAAVMICSTIDFFAF